MEHTFFSGPGDGQAHRLDGHWFDCLGESNEPIDEDLGRHGTAMVALLLRLLPHAEIYVVRVARGMKSDAESGVEGLSILKESTSKVTVSSIIYVHSAYTDSRPSATPLMSGTLISCQCHLASPKK